MNDNCCKNFVHVALATFLIVAALATLIWAWSVYKKVGNISANSTMTVSATGKVTAKPDLSVVVFSVVSQGLNPQNIQKENDVKMGKAINYLKSADVKEEDIKTISYNLSPQYDYTWCHTGESYIYCPPKIVSYMLTQRVETKIRDISKVGEVIGNLPENGVNEISSISFTVDDEDAGRVEAREKAIERAAAKALAISKTSGVKLGRIINISENEGYLPQPYYLKEAEGLGGGETSPIQSGSQEITVSISITYEIK